MTGIVHTLEGAVGRTLEAMGRRRFFNIVPVRADNRSVGPSAPRGSVIRAGVIDLSQCAIMQNEAVSVLACVDVKSGDVSPGVGALRRRG